MSGRQASRGSLKILIVDDMTSMRKTLRQQLVSLGFASIVEAKDALEAMQRMEFEVFDLVISDWHMPAMSGFELLEFIRSQKRHEETPFIMLTREAARDSVLTARSAGVVHYLAKPFNVGALEEKLRAALPTLT